MTARLIAIGDIHGCLAALRTILDAIAPGSDDTIVTLGDYIDRGPDSRGTIDSLIHLQSSCRLVPLLGNHDVMLIDILNGQPDLLPDWLLFGGNATLDVLWHLKAPKNSPGSYRISGKLPTVLRDRETYLPAWHLRSRFAA